MQNFSKDWLKDTIRDRSAAKQIERILRLQDFARSKIRHLKERLFAMCVIWRWKRSMSRRTHKHTRLVSFNCDKEYIMLETVVKIFNKRFLPFKNYSKRVKSDYLL